MKLKTLALELYRPLRAIALTGDRFYCPLCEGRFRAFLPIGVVARPNARCPWCDSLERHRLLWVALQQLWQDGKIRRGGKLMHVAPEASLARRFRQDFDYLSVDISSDTKAMQVMDIRRIPLPDQTFDAIACHHVLEHIPEDAQALSELYRVLKPGGWASIQVPMAGDVTQEDLSITDPAVRQRLYGQPDHVRQYGRDFQQRLEAAGFQVQIYSKQAICTDESLERLSVECETEVWICLKNR